MHNPALLQTHLQNHGSRFFQYALVQSQLSPFRLFTQKGKTDISHLSPLYYDEMRQEKRQQQNSVVP